MPVFSGLCVSNSICWLIFTGFKHGAEPGTPPLTIFRYVTIHLIMYPSLLICSNASDWRWFSWLLYGLSIQSTTQIQELTVSWYTLSKCFFLSVVQPPKLLVSYWISLYLRCSHTAGAFTRHLKTCLVLQVTWLTDWNCLIFPCMSLFLRYLCLAFAHCGAIYVVWIMVIIRA